MGLLVEVVTEQDLRDYLRGRLDAKTAGAIITLLESDPVAQALLRKAALRITPETDQPRRGQSALGGQVPPSHRLH